jgi:hypothetical protein
MSLGRPLWLLCRWSKKLKGLSLKGGDVDWDRPKIDLELFLEEVRQEHFAKALEWSGPELVAKPQLSNAVMQILKSTPEFTKIVLGMSNSTYKDLGSPEEIKIMRVYLAQRIPSYIANSLQAGICMGIALVLELLNERDAMEEGALPDENKTPSSTTVQ